MEKIRTEMYNELSTKELKNLRGFFLCLLCEELLSMREEHQQFGTNIDKRLATYNRILTQFRIILKVIRVRRRSK